MRSPLPQKLPTQVTFVTCITGGYYGYFPTADAYSEGGYEARSSIFGPTVADDLVAAARNLQLRRDGIMLPEASEKELAHAESPVRP